MKKQIQCIVVLFTLLTILNGLAYSANEHFRSVASGNWDSTSTWEMSTNGGGTWVAATITPDNTSNTITIQSPNTVTVTADVSADQLVVNSGGQIIISTGITLTVLDGSGNDLSINSGGTISGPGIVQTQGTVDFSVPGPFNAPLKVNTGILTYPEGGSVVLNGAVTIDSGATLNIVETGSSVGANSSVTNNGTITGNSGSTLSAKGSPFINNGTISVHTLSFDDTLSLSGAGSYTGNTINIAGPGNVTLTSNVTISPTSAFVISSGTALHPNSNTLTYTSGTLTLAGGTVSNPGTIQAQGTVGLTITGGNFSGSFKVNSGTTTCNEQGAFVINGTVTVDAGATLFINENGSAVTANNSVTNNGTISGNTGSTFIARGTPFINNGSISVHTLSFDDTLSLSGAGSYTGNTINIAGGGNVTLTSNITFSPTSSFVISSGTALHPNSNTLTYNSGTLSLNGGTVSSPGTIQAQGTVGFIITSGNFSASFKVNSGTTTCNEQGGFAINGAVIVDAGATLFINENGSAVTANNSVTNNGTISGNSGSTFIARGTPFINNGSISVHTLSFDDTLSLSGAGSFTSNTINIAGSGVNVALTSDVTFSPTSAFNISGGTVLNPNTFTATYTSGFISVSGIVSSSGLVQTQGTVGLNVTGSNFNAALKVNTGTTTCHESGGGVYNGTVTIDSGATLNVNNTGSSIRVYNDVLNNGIITGVNSSFRFYGTNCVNNGSVTISNFYFETGAQTLQGTGNSMDAQILSGSSVTLLSDHQMNTATIFSGGTFNITSRKLLVSRSGTPIGVIGSMITTGSTIEYNGTAVQNVQATNLNYNNLTINNAAGVNLPDAETVPGILRLTSGAFIIGANLTMGNGATIVRQDGSLSGTPTFGAGVHVIYIGTNATSSGTELPSSNTVLKNLTVNNSGGVTLSNTRTVNDTLFLMKGGFSNGANLTLATGATINRGVGILNSVPTFGTSVNVVYSDTAAVLTGNEIPVSTTILNNLTINNTGGVTLSVNSTSNGILTFLNGLLTIGSNILTLGPSSSVGGTPSNSKMIVASGTGTVRKNFTGTGSFLFPVGDNTGTAEFSPITLNFVSGTFGGGAYAEVNLKNVKHPNNQSPEHYISRYWTVGQNNITSFSCGVMGTYVDADIVGNELTMWTGSWNGSSWTLLNQADALNNQISGTVASFSDFTGGRKSELGGTANTFFAAGNYSDPTKWSSEKTPLASDVAIIAANCVVDITIPNLSSLTINSGVTLDMTTFELPNIATINNNGTIKTQNAGVTPLPSGITYLGTIEYNAIGAQTVVNSTYTNLTISGSGNKNKNGSFTVESSLNLNGGSLSIGANTLTINGSISEAGGTLTGGSSSNITFGGTGPGDRTTNEKMSDVFVNNITTEFLSSTNLPAVTLNNLTINRASGIGLGGNVTVEGTLDLQNGALSINANTLTLNGSINISSGSLVGGTTSDLTIGGSGSQISLQTISLNNLTLNRGNGIILNGAVSIEGTLTLTNGDAELNGQSITLGATASLAETAGNTVKGATGFITTTRILNNISSLNVGGLGAELTTTQNMGSTTITRIHAQQTGDSNVSILRSYDITPTNNTGLNATLEFNYDESELNSIPEANLTLFRSTNSGTNWSLRGGTPDPTNNNVALTGISSFSSWTLGNNDSPLVLENLQLTLLMEGFYDEDIDIMVSDTVRAYLRNTFAPYSIVDSSIALVSSTGVGLYTFKYATDEINYYIQLKHRNSLETWSKFGNSFTSSSLNYNFTTDSAKAFGNNMKRVDDSPVRFAIYSGDVNQNGVINLIDIIEVYNNANTFIGGYVSTDVTGDNSTNLADIVITYNNAAIFVSKITP